DSDNTLFPEVEYFKSEWAFKQTAYNPKWHLLFDTSSLIGELEREKSQNEIEKAALSETNETLMAQMKSDYGYYIEGQLVKTKKELQAIGEIIQSIKSEVNNLYEEMEQVKERARS